jgi:CheY-like chemotaxis protein
MHAMKEGGSLFISTFNRTLSKDDASIMNLEPGDYVQLSLRDTGNGIDENTLDKIFDPFFTTKGAMGTGLGLTQVYGFVKRSKGAITIDSSLNGGTYISLYFPRHFSDEASEEIIDDEIVIETGKETLLVVDDEDALRTLAYDLLSSKGYNVLLASSGDEALNILAENDVDLMISDVVMPNMDGYKLAAQVSEKFPQVKIQLVSGYHDDRSHTEADEILNKTLLNKPFTSKSLYETVRKRLDEK